MAVRHATKTGSEQLREIAEMYRNSGEPWPASARQIAVWAINNGHYKVHRDKVIAKAAEEIAAAMREEYYTDPKGRRVRVLHASRVSRKLDDGTSEHPMLWDDIRTAPHKFMERAFQLRRRQIVGECKQLKTDVDSYNDLHPDRPKIQLVLTFTEDVAEGEQPTTYRPSNPR